LPGEARGELEDQQIGNELISKAGDISSSEEQEEEEVAGAGAGGGGGAGSSWGISWTRRSRSRTPSQILPRPLPDR